jgi:hypothetical protein
MSPRRGSTPRQTDRLTVSRNVTLTLMVDSMKTTTYDSDGEEVLAPSGIQTCGQDDCILLDASSFCD